MFAALAVLTLSGCAEEKGATLPSVTSSPEAASASPSLSVVGGRAGVPDAAMRHTRAGAEAFARYYLDMVNVAWQTPDATVLKQLGDEGCDFCNDVTRIATELTSQNRRYDGPAIRVTRMGPLSGDWLAVDEAFSADIVQLPASIVDASGEEVEPQTEKSVKRHIVITWVKGEWTMYEMAP